MFDIHFPLLTTFLSGFLAFALGLVWYHPRIMGGQWMAARGLNKSAATPASLPFVVSFLLWMVAAIFYSFLADFLNVADPAALFCLSSLLWVAFAMPPTLMGALYTGYPFQAMAIDSAYQLAGYFAFAAVHAGMQLL